MTDTPQVLLAHHLKTLKRAESFAARIRQAGSPNSATEGADHVRYLVRLTELATRIDRRAPHGRAADQTGQVPLPSKASTASTSRPIASLNKISWFWSWRECEYVERRENIIALGNSGTGTIPCPWPTATVRCSSGATSMRW